MRPLTLMNFVNISVMVAIPTLLFTNLTYHDNSEPAGFGTPLYSQARAILDSYGAQDVRMEIMETGEKCLRTERTLACANIGLGPIYVNKAILESSYSLEMVLAHEYVHVLTNYNELKWIEENLPASSVLDFPEVIADCGARFFVDDESDSYQMSIMSDNPVDSLTFCSPELNEISRKIIYDEKLTL
jgi:hypothetical protein